MDITYPPEAEAYRHEIRAFLSENLPEGWTGIGALSEAEAQAFLEDWRAKLQAHGFVAIGWPEQYGGTTLEPVKQVVLAEEFFRANAPRGLSTDGFSIGMCGNTILQWGTEEQKAFFLPRIVAGEIRLCQGYSEPNAGSDLASLTTSAVHDGERWRINGQKIWTTAGLDANWIFLLARTGEPGSRHKGITFLMAPIDQPGIEVRPIRMMSGPSEFCEVFFDDAVALDEHVIGAVDDGWRVANTLLGFERTAAASRAALYRAELDRLIVEARERGTIEDPQVRTALVRCHTSVELLRFAGYRILSTLLSGQTPGPESSLSKLAVSTYHRYLGEVAIAVLGTDALAPAGRAAMNAIGPDVAGGVPTDRSWAEVFMNSRAGTIYGGTSEIQRSIIGERLLGLPREPKPT